MHKPGQQVAFQTKCSWKSHCQWLNFTLGVADGGDKPALYGPHTLACITTYRNVLLKHKTYSHKIINLSAKFCHL